MSFLQVFYHYWEFQIVNMFIFIELYSDIYITCSKKIIYIGNKIMKLLFILIFILLNTLNLYSQLSGQAKIDSLLKELPKMKVRPKAAARPKIQEKTPIPKEQGQYLWKQTFLSIIQSSTMSVCLSVRPSVWSLRSR